MNNWHLCERWWVRGYSCAYHQLVEDEPEDDDEEDEKFPWPIPVPAKAKGGSEQKGERVSVSVIKANTVPYVVAAEPEVLVPVGGSDYVGLVSPPGVVFKPFAVPALVPDGFPGVSPAPIPGGFPGSVARGGTGFEPGDPFGGTAGSTPALIEGLGGPHVGGINNPADVARAAGIAVAAVVATAAILKGANPAAGRASAAAASRIGGLFFVIRQQLAKAETALTASIDESYFASLTWNEQQEARGYEGGTVVPGQSDLTRNRAIVESDRGSRPPLLFNAIRKFEGLQFNSDFDWHRVGLNPPD